MRRKLIKIIPICVACVSLLASCGQTSTSLQPISTNQTSSSTQIPGIRLRSSANQQLKVGEEIKIVYSLENITLNKGETTEDKVSITSSDEKVVTVDDWANATAVGVGEATVRIALKDDSSVFVEVFFTITKTFFVQENGLKNGNIDFTDEDNGSIMVNDGQSQVLVNSLDTNWYFTTRIDRTGYTGNDNIGAWGVGSFLVNSSHPIGDNMFWLMLGNKGGNQNQVMVRYGGWRYSGAAGQQDFAIDSAQHDISNGVYLTIARLNERHFMIADFGNGDVVKYSMDVDAYKDIPTYPGVYGQNQKYLVSEFEVVTGEEATLKKLADFQPAESISMNVIDTRLDNNQTYQLTSKVLPETTVDKTAEYTLTQELDGVTLTKDGLLTIDANVNGQIKVKATSSVESIYDEVTFTIGDKVTGTGLFNNDRIYETEANSVSVSSNSLTISQGDAYIPFNITGNKWFVSFDVTNNGTITNDTEVGLLSTIPGYMDYDEFAIQYTTNARRYIKYGRLNGKYDEVAYARDNTSSTISMGLVRDGSNYYLIVNGKTIKHYESDFASSTPVLYSKGCNISVTNVVATTTDSEINEAMKDKFYVGGYVEREEETYNLAAIDLSKESSNWPPENDYANGLKLKESLTGEYIISFNMSNISPVNVNGEYDGKVLVYLKSESVTCSLQFVFKGTPSSPTYAIVPNFDDNTWTEHPLPSSIDLTKEVKVEIIKTLDNLQLYIDGVRVFQDETYMNNYGYWNENTVCTPGISSFLCGVTIKNPSISKWTYTDTTNK